MSTSGGSRNRRTGRVISFTALLGALLAAAFAAGSPAEALTPPPADKAEIVFENGGRIVSIKADGSGRRVLTRKAGPIVAERSWDATIPVEDSDPSISPDGTKLLFRRDRDLDHDEWTASVVVANRDGSGQQEIALWKNNGFDYLGWSPDSRIVVGVSSYATRNRQEEIRNRVISMDHRGVDRKVLLDRTIRRSDFASYERFMRAWLTPVDVSPDGRSLLYAFGGPRQADLWVHDIETGKDRKLIAGADGGSFSPDGQRVVFTASTCRKSNGDECRGRKPGIWRASADGSAQTRLLGGGGGEPEWSPDGKTVIFSSSRNFPGGGNEALEVYSVGVDGKCLTWLTNGSPESTDASWGPEAFDSRPSGCGANGLKPLVEVAPRAGKTASRPRLWAGPEIRGRLLSSTSLNRNYESYYYEDCGFFERSKCREPMLLESYPVCNPGNMGDSVNILPGRMIPSIRKGALFTTMVNRRGSSSALLLTGNSWLAFGDSMFTSHTGIPTTITDLNFVMNRLRPVGGGIPTSLPAPMVEDPGEVSRIYWIYGRTGSIAETARRLGTSRAEVRWLIRWKSVMTKLMPFKEIKCAR